MARFKEKFINARFEMVMKELGLPTVGAEHYALDYYSYGGGWMIVRVREGGGHSTPFGATRYRAAAFVDVLGVIRDTAALMRETPKTPELSSAGQIAAGRIYRNGAWIDA